MPTDTADSVSSLVTTLQKRQDGQDVSFASCIRQEIKTLRKQLDKPGSLTVQGTPTTTRAEASAPAPDGDLSALLQALRMGAAGDSVETNSAWAKLVRGLTGMRSTGATVPLDF